MCTIDAGALEIGVDVVMEAGCVVRSWLWSGRDDPIFREIPDELGWNSFYDRFRTQT